MIKTIRKFKYLLLSLFLVFSATGIAVATAIPASATVALVTYSVTGNCVGSGGCTTHITIVSNPSNGGVRAWESCGGNGSNFILTGSWHFSVGQTSNTASCSAVRSGTFTEYAGFDYPKSPTVQYQCYNFFNGNGKSGEC
jgi:hypothetical protein